MDVHQMTRDPYLCPPQTKQQKQQALQQQAQQMAQQQPSQGSSGTGAQLNFGGGGSLSGNWWKQGRIIIKWTMFSSVAKWLMFIIKSFFVGAFHGQNSGDS